MARAIKVNEGYENIAMPNGQLANAGDTVLLTDEQFGQLNPTLLGSALSDEGEASDADFEELNESDDEGDGGSDGGSDDLDSMTHDELDQKAEDDGVEDYRKSDNKDDKIKALKDADSGS